MLTCTKPPSWRFRNVARVTSSLLILVALLAFWLVGTIVPSRAFVSPCGRLAWKTLRTPSTAALLSERLPPLGRSWHSGCNRRNGVCRISLVVRHAEKEKKQGYRPVQPLHIVSYNIKGFGVGFGATKKTSEEVAQAYEGIRHDIARLQPDIVSLNEVMRFPFTDLNGNKRADSLEALAADLGDMQVRFAHATPGFERFGNAVLVHPDIKILGNSSVHLNGGSIVKTKDGREKRIIRGALAVHLKVAEPQAPDPKNPVPPPGLSIVSTHWDHISDKERCRQASGLGFLRDQLTAGLPHLVLGDLNAIKRTDYSPQEWSAIQARNRKNGWLEPAHCDSVYFLERAGYVDLLERSLGGVHDMASAPSELKMTASTDEPRVRIDYAYMNDELVEALEKCRRGPPGMPQKPFPARAFVDRGATGSDHYPLCVEMVRR